MARLPQPGGDSGNWGDILNDYLSQVHNADGSLKPIPQSKITSLTSDLAGKASSAALEVVADTVTALSDRVADAEAAIEALPEIDTDGTLAANSDTRVASQKAVKAYINATVTAAVAAVAPPTNPIITPATSARAGSISVVLSGMTGATSVSAVSFISGLGGTVITSPTFTVNNDAQITLTVDTSTSGISNTYLNQLVALRLTKNGNTFEFAAKFTVTGAPIMSSIVPVAGSTISDFSGPSTLTVNGFGFTGSTAVQLLQGGTVRRTQNSVSVNTTEAQLTFNNPVQFDDFGSAHDVQMRILHPAGNLDITSNYQVNFQP